MIIAAVILGLIVLFVIYLYNKLVVFGNRIDNAWSQVDVQLKKRYDLIPNLMETVKGYASHEKELFEKVTRARSEALSAQNVKEQGKAENMLSETLKSLFAVTENYPDLKANQNFLMLQEELSGIESKIAFARQFYNDSVLAYDNAREVFPTSIVAGIFNFAEKHYFQMEEAEKEPVKVKF